MQIVPRGLDAKVKSGRLTFVPWKTKLLKRMFVSKALNALKIEVISVGSFQPRKEQIFSESDRKLNILKPGRRTGPYAFLYIFLINGSLTSKTESSISHKRSGSSWIRRAM